MTTRQMLVDVVTQCKYNLQLAETQLDEFDSLAENNVFETMEIAEKVIFKKLKKQAFDDCEGADNCGNDEYTQEFIVDNEKYIAIAEFEYDRHDKTYYYIDRSNFKVEKL